MMFKVSLPKIVMYQHDCNTNEHKMRTRRQLMKHSASCRPILTILLPHSLFLRLWSGCYDTISGFIENEHLRLCPLLFRCHARSMSTRYGVYQLQSKLLYDFQFTVNKFILTPRPLRLTTRGIFFFNWTLTVIVLLWREDGFASYKYVWPFVKRTYRTYSMLLKILPFALYKSPVLVQALQSRSYLSYVSYATTAA
jgi:hypothetical protein